MSEVEQIVVYSYVAETSGHAVLDWLFYSAVLAGGLALVFGVAITVRKRRQNNQRR